MRRFGRRLVPLILAVLSSRSGGAAELGTHPGAKPVGAVPTLGEVIALARARAPSVLVGAAHVKTARADLVGARVSPLGNPYVELTGEHGSVGTASATLSATGTLWLPFEIGGQRGARVDAAKAGIEYRSRALELSRAQAVAAAIEAYGHSVVGAARLRLLQELEAVARAEADAYRARFQAGDVTAQDARFADVDRARYGVMVAEATADLAAALSTLEVVTGRRFDAPPTEPLSPPPVDLGRGMDSVPAVAAARAEAAFHGRERRRWESERAGALSLMLLGGADELGGARVGAGLAYAFPAFRAYQGERARAEAEEERALLEARLGQERVGARLAGIARERTEVERALGLLHGEAEPAARAAVEAAEEMRRLGKGEFLAVLTSRRDLALLRLRQLDLLERRWGLESTAAALTGRTP
ncbi:MAG TPA: TolC family protein [Polyangiaceae bacterium]|nr:TolC family protein [Polyangiaceae bacterium]